MIKGGERNGAQRQTPYTVLIVDDAEFIRRGIAAILSEAPEFTVCGFAADEAGTVQMLERHRPDLLLLDLALRHRDGLQFLKDIGGRFDDTRIIALCDYEDEFYAGRARHARASACLTKHASASELLRTVRAVAAGDRDKQAQRSVPRLIKGRQGPNAHDHSLPSLSDREFHVFWLIGAGLGTKRIAQELGLSGKTIETYREHIKTKLGYLNAEALRKGALEWVHHSPAGSLDARKDRGNPR